MHTGVRAAAISWKPRSFTVGWMDRQSPDARRWGGWSSALITLPSAVLPLSPLLLPLSPSPRAVFVYRNEPCVVTAAAFYSIYASE